MELKGGVINAREVARARRLVVLGGDGEGVRVDTNSGHVGEVLVRLYPVEVVTAALLEAVVAVELHESRHDRVVTGEALHEGVGVARLKDGAVPRIGVVEGLLAVVRVHGVIVAADEIVTLDNPGEELHGVVEVHADLVGGGRDRLLAGELELLDEVLVRVLGELAALIGVEVDVVNKERASLETLLAHVVCDGRVIGPAHILYGGKVDLDLNLVVLEGDEGESKSGVAAVEELKGDVQGVGRGTLASGGRLNGERVTIRGTGVVTALTTGLKKVHELGHVTDHTGVTTLLAGGERQLVPDVHPVTVLLVDLLTTNLQLYLLDEIVAGPVEPAEVGLREVRRRQTHVCDINLGKSRLHVRLPDKVTVARDLARHVLATKRGGAIEGLLDRLDGKVGVTTVDYLEEGDLRVTREIHILSTISYKLHKTTTHFKLYHTCNIFFRNVLFRYFSGTFQVFLT